MFYVRFSLHSDTIQEPQFKRSLSDTDIRERRRRMTTLARRTERSVMLVVLCMAGDAFV